MKTKNQNGTWKSYIECPKKFNIKSYLIERCLDLKLNHDIKSIDLYQDTIDKILGIKRETIYFNIEGNINNLTILYKEIKKIAK